MKTKILKPLLAMACLLSSINVSAYDFEVDGIYYDVVSLSELTCKVVKKSMSYRYSGDIIIPEAVTYNGRTFSVVSIGEGAFEECDELKSITLPNSIKEIEYFAFENCI